MVYQENKLRFINDRISDNVSAIRNKFNVIDINEHEFMIDEKIGKIVLRKQSSDMDVFLQVFIEYGY